jgi:uroporphyrin-III C-methyltransferase/precorrin-2 dehydrogenase/sirohydrochlorin ferrochelatase
MTMTQRTPQPMPPRIAPIATLPAFHKLDGRKVVVAGASEGALWKAELLSAAGANVLVLAGDSADLFALLAANPVAGPVTVEPRSWSPADLTGAALAFADLPDHAEALAFVAAARVAGAPVNIIDQTALCDFQLGTIVNRSPVIIAISTGGGAPMLGQSIRTRIEAVLPLGLAAWGRAALAWRPRLKQAIATLAERRDFWGRFTTRAWANIDRAPDESDFRALLIGAPTEPRGSVILVGAGPGDPELLTLKAVRALQAATVILYDDLVTPGVLELARREARRIAVGKTGYGPSCSQADINAQVVALALAGETVVRLKGGDPLIFGRATEEIDACHAAGVPVTIVPGISAAQGAAASLGFSLTERHHARRIQFVTGHGADGKLPRDIDWPAIADARATTVIYMPRKTLSEFVAKAVAAGLDPSTPAIAIASATRDNEAHVAATLGALPAEAATHPAGAPVTIIVGAVARGEVAALALRARTAA